MKSSRVVSLRSLLAASISGKVVYALSSLISLPLLTKLLGAESIGLVGFFTTLLMSMMVLEGGLTSNLIHQLASYRSRSLSAYRDYTIAQRCLVFTYFVIFLMIGFASAIIIISLSSYIVGQWLEIQSIPLANVVTSVKLMGVFIALNFPVMVLQGVLIGNENQKLLNKVFIPYALFRTVGAWILLRYLFESPSVLQYFILQLMAQVIYVLSLLCAVYKEHLLKINLAFFRVYYLKKGLAFSRGVLLVSVSSMLVVQIDKIYLSGNVSLGAYASYTLASTLAGLPYIFSSAFSSVLFPRFSNFLTTHDNNRLAKIYASSLTIIFLLMINFIAAIVFYSRLPVSLIFTEDIANGVNDILPILVLATSIQCILVVPFALQLAGKWTSLSLNINLLSIPLIVLLLPCAVHEFGVSGGAYIWLMYNVFSLMCTFYFVLKKHECLKSSALSLCQDFIILSVSVMFFYYLVTYLTERVVNIYLALFLQSVSVLISLGVGVIYFKKRIKEFN